MQQLLLNLPQYTKFTATNKLNGKKVRCMKENDNSFFCYGPRKKRYGWRFTLNEFIQKYEDFDTNEDTEQKWKRRLKTASKKLTASGLWNEQLKVINQLLTMDFKDWKDMKTIYYLDRYNPKLLQYKQKYPFLFTMDDHGNPIVNYVYFSPLAECHLKSMYFGKRDNNIEKETIKKHLINQTNYYTGRIPVNYDVSFEYNAKAQKAWYSEEYRNCGNGHYYIALDHNTALYIEDD